MSLTTSKTAKKFLTTDLIHGYQWRAADFVEVMLKCALFIDMGLGKTVITLTALARLLETLMIDKTLVVAPLNVANETWPEELNTWEHAQDITFKLITGNPKQRAKALDNNCDVDIVSITNLPWLIDYFGKDWPYSTLVIDESSMFKDRKTVRFKKLRLVARRCLRVIELTGTPTSNGLIDLWSQIYLLDQGQRLGASFKTYTDRFFHCNNHGDYKTYTPKKGAEEEIYKLLSDICLTLKSEDYLEISEPVHIPKKVKLPPKLRAMYNELEKEMILELEKDDVEAQFAADLSDKLLQFCNGALYFEDKSYEVVHDLKIDILKEIVESACGKPIIVAYHYISDKERILKAFPDFEVYSKKNDSKTRWNNGEIPGLLLHPLSAGHGLNLQHGGNVLVWFGPNWSLELTQQTNERIGPTRQKQSGYDRPSIYYEIFVEDTVDEMVIRRLQGKSDIQQSLLNALRVDLNKRVKK